MPRVQLDGHLDWAGPGVGGKGEGLGEEVKEEQSHVRNLEALILREYLLNVSCFGSCRMETES